MALTERETWTPRRQGRWTLADGRGLVAAFESRPAAEAAAAFARRFGLDVQRVLAMEATAWLSVTAGRLAPPATHGP